MQEHAHKSYADLANNFIQGMLKKGVIFHNVANE